LGVPAVIDLEKSYAGRSVLVTGHTGFKGTWLCSWLDRLSARVTGLALAPEDPKLNLFDATRLGQRLNSVIGDIRDPNLVRETMSAAAPEIVFHLAAQPLVRRSYRDPIGTYATNLLGTVHVLEACRQVESVRAVVVVTTDKCYDNQEQDRPFRETDPLGGKDPYSASKACAELAAASYAAAVFTGGRPLLATARGGNVIGGGDWSEDRLIPDAIRALTRGAPLELRFPDSIRPWQHVLELARGYLTLGGRLLAGDKSAAGAWNFGPRSSERITVRSLVDRIAARWTPPGLAVAAAPSPLPEAKLLRLDISKAEANLGWAPLLDIDATVDMTADWYGRHHRGEDAGRLVGEQIDRYVSALG
jgi:CDP-glucose 4,6-dehydratase